MVGARFDVVNQVPGHRPWKNPRGDGVRAAPPLRRQPDRAFAGTLVWSSEVEPEGEGTLLTESHEVTRPVGRIGWLVIGRLFARTTGAPTSARGIANLDALKATAEAQHQDRVG